jgi:hypothetical protein
MTAVARRVVVYDALGEIRGQLPNALRIDYISRLNEPSTLTIDGADLADFPDLLDGWHAVRFERYNEDADNWRRDLNDMFLLDSVDLDPLDPLKVTAYRYNSVAVQPLLGAPIFELDKDGDPPDPSLGPPPGGPVRSFSNKYPGAVMQTLLEEAQAAGWCPEFVWTFDGTTDSDGMAWPVPLKLDIPCKWNLYMVLTMLAETGMADWCTQGNALNMYVADTFLNEDLSVGDEPVTLVNGMGVTKAPVNRSYRDQATDVRGFTEDGKTVEDNNPGLTLPAGVGKLWRTVTISGTADSSTADFALQAELRIGGGARESFTREVDYDWTDPNDPTVRGIQPGLDFEIGSRIRVETDNIDAEDGHVHFATHRVIEYRIKIADDQTQKGHLILANRQERAIDRQQRALARIAGGAAGGWLGDVIKPLLDLRRPDPPDEPVMSGFTSLVAGETRVTFLAEITALETTHDTEGDIEEPIQIARVHLCAKRGDGLMVRVRSGEWVAPSVVLDYPNQDPNVEYTFKVEAESHDGFLSHRSDASDPITVDADTNPLDRINLVEDSAHLSSLRRQAREDATTGLSFLTDGTAGLVAALSTTSTVLKYGVTGAIDTPNAGRFKVQAGDTVYNKALAKRVGASAATAKLQTVFFYDDGTTSTQTAATQVTGTSYTSMEGTTSPIKDGFAEIRVILDSIIGAGTVRIAQAYATRQIEAHDIRAGAITADRIDVGSLNGVTITGLIINAGQLNASSIDATDISGGSITGTTVTATDIVGGTIDGTVIDGVTINGSEINSSDIDAISLFAAGGQIGNITFTINTIYAASGTGHLDGALGDWTCSGDFSAVTLTETSARAGKADLRKMLDPRRLLKVPTWTFRKARDTGGPRQVGLMAEDVADAGLEELVTRGEDGKPVGLKYSRVVAVLLDIVREQDERIERLEASNGR